MKTATFSLTFPSTHLLTSSLLATSLISVNAGAEMLWSKNALSYLKNSEDFEVVTNKNIDVFTFEHASAHHWGDVFMFVDRLDAKADNDNDARKETYSEVNARLSLSYLTGNSLTYGPIKDILIASTYEYSTVSSNSFNSGFDNYLLGVGIAWQVPGFRFFNTNVFYVNNELKDNDKQLTVNWGYPIIIGNHKLMFDGYIDWSSAENDHAADFHFNPQLRLDIGHYFNKPDFFEAGIEYSYWHNKFGISDIDDQSVFSFMIKVNL